MEIGYLGDLIFETSDKRILTLQNFTRDTAAQFAKHDRIGKKAASEFIAPELGKVSFTVQLNASLGVIPSEEIEKFRVKCETGKAEFLVIGGSPIGDDRWVILSVGEAWNKVWDDGKLYSANLDISLEEYITEINDD